VGSQRRGHAVVCGASMAGLLAAQVLADAYGSITVVERDVLPEAPAQRRGVSQGRHLHALLRRGSLVLEELLPGLFDELVASGANVIDGTDASVIRAQVGDHLLSRSGTFADPDSLLTHVASRPLLEAHVRRRVRALPNVAFLENHDAVEPVLGHADRVTAARVVDRATSQERSLEADIVVDATGRSARTPAFLEMHGYPGPPEQKYAVGLSYSSQFFRVPDGALVEKMVLTAPTLDRPTGAGLLAYEHGTVILTLIGIAGHRLPTDLPGMMALVAELLPDSITDALHAAEPLGNVTAQHYPTSAWRRYDKLKRFPRGFAVIGDAVCSFNPVYGQGMTSAAIQAKALRDSLIDADADNLSQLYFRHAAKKIAPMWRANRLNDFAVIPVHDWRSIPQRILNWQLDKLMAAASNDLAVTETFLRILGLTAPPTRLLRPAMLSRVIKANRHAANHGETRPINSDRLSKN
jgi:2-polyprenyl-6-methoxyphenol hydroxylase-like FAD-dependent oxidoreductase